MSEISKIDQLPFAIVVEGEKEDELTDEEILRRREEEYNHFLASEFRLVDRVKKAVILSVIGVVKEEVTNIYALFEIPELKDVSNVKMHFIRSYIQSSTMQEALDQSLTSAEKKMFKIDVDEIRLKEAVEHGFSDIRLWVIIREREEKKKEVIITEKKEEKEVRSKLNYIVDLVCGVLLILLAFCLMVYGICSIRI